MTLVSKTQEMRSKLKLCLSQRLATRLLSLRASSMCVRSRKSVSRETSFLTYFQSTHTQRQWSSSWTRHIMRLAWKRVWAMIRFRAVSPCKLPHQEVLMFPSSPSTMTELCLIVWHRQCNCQSASQCLSTKKRKNSGKKWTLTSW